MSIQKLIKRSIHGSLQSKDTSTRVLIQTDNDHEKRLNRRCEFIGQTSNMTFSSQFHLLVFLQIKKDSLASEDLLYNKINF